MDQMDSRKVEILRRVLSETPRREPAPNFSREWGSLRLALEEPMAIRLGRKDNSRQAKGVFDPDAESLAVIIDDTLEVFGSDVAREVLLKRAVGSRPLELRNLSVEAVSSNANHKPTSAWAIVRPNFSFFIREEGRNTT